MVFLNDILFFVSFFSDRFYIKLFLSVPTAFYLIYMTGRFLGWFNDDN